MPAVKIIVFTLGEYIIDDPDCEQIKLRKRKSDLHTAKQNDGVAIGRSVWGCFFRFRLRFHVHSPYKLKSVRNLKGSESMKEKNGYVSF